MRSIFIILIGIVYHPIIVFNKDSYRVWGSCLKTFALCKICKVSVSWICHKCNKIEEFKHYNYYCTNWITRRLELGLGDSNPLEMIINR